MQGLSEAMRNFTGLTVITVVFLGAAFTLVACNHTVNRKARNTFLICFATLALIAIADWVTYVADGTLPELRLVHAGLIGLTFAVAPALPVMVANTVNPGNGSRWILVLLAFNAVFELGSIVGGYAFWVDFDNVYHRTTLYPVYIAVYTIVAVYLVVKTVEAARIYQMTQIATVFGTLACMFTGVIIQVFDSTVRMTWPAVSMAVVLYFILYSEMVLRTDALTKLLNRRSFEDALEKPPLPCVVAVLDVDDFKCVNDTYGHAFGDECLIRMANMIRRSLGPAGLCYRTGGDEFVVIMTKRTGEANALADKLLQAVADAQAQDERMPGLSIGMCTADAGSENLDEAFKKADEAMYRNKRERKAVFQ